MKRVFIIHGWDDSPQGSWFPWLKNRLTEKGFEVIVPAMPDPSRPNLESWLPFLQQTVGKVSKDTYLVGHSTGVITILRYLEAMKEGDKTGGAVLVGGFGTDLKYLGYNHELSSFFFTPVDWIKIRSHCPKFISIHSSNDPWVSLDNSELFKQNLGAETLIIPEMKHFSGDDGINELPIALSSVLKLSS